MSTAKEPSTSSALGQATRKTVWVPPVQPTYTAIALAVEVTSRDHLPMQLTTYEDLLEARIRTLIAAETESEAKAAIQDLAERGPEVVTMPKEQWARLLIETPTLQAVLDRIDWDAGNGLKQPGYQVRQQMREQDLRSLLEAMDS